MTNILVTAAGCPGFLNIRNSIKSSSLLRDILIHGCDMNPDSLGLKFVEHSFKSPNGASPKYISTIFRYCKKNNIKLIIPCSDEELIPLATAASDFLSISCKILVSESLSLKKILNKGSLFKFCKKVGLGQIIPSYNICNNVDDLSKLYHSFEKKGITTCVKPVSAHGSRGFRIIKENISKKDFFSQKNIQNNISFSDLCKILSDGGKSFQDLIIMEYLDGEEYSVDCLRTKKNFFCIPRSRDQIKEGICTGGETKQKQDLIRLSKILYNALDLKYNVNLQFKYNSQGQPKLLEINPRVSGTMEHCRGAGVDLLEAAICEVLSIENENNYKIKWGTKLTRVWKEIFEYNGRVINK
tara:strand:+ start:3706 stop:4770 length:1065 start_codon:yes stop_codon:yes gene_type:complete